MKQEKYLVKSFGDNQEGTNVGLKKFFELCGRDGNGVIVVPMLKNLAYSMFAIALGEELSKKFIKERTLSISEGTTISLCSSNTLKNFTRANVYLALWGSDDMIQDIEKNCQNYKSIVLVTWLPKDSEEWTKNSSVLVIYDDKKS